MNQELQEELFYYLEYPELEPESEPQLNHKWSKSVKAPSQMLHGVLMERKCTRCGCVEHRWYTRKGLYPQVSHSRNGRNKILELDGSLECIDWNDNKL